MKTTATTDLILSLEGDTFEPKEDKTQSARAYRAIRGAILQCKLAPGEMIDDRRLMEELGFGRTPVREALLRLASDRLVHFLDGQGIQVAAIGLSEIRDLYEDRLHSERLAARLMMERITPRKIDEFKHCFDQSEELLRKGKLEETIALDFRFHSLIYHGSENKFLIHHLHHLFGHSYRLWYLTREDDVKAMRATVKTHDQLVAAIVNGKSEWLDMLLKRHIIEAYEHVLERIRGRSIDTIGNMEVLTLQNIQGKKHAERRAKK